MAENTATTDTQETEAKTTTETTTGAEKTEAAQTETKVEQTENKDGKEDSLLGKKSPEDTTKETEKVVPESYEFKMPEGRELDKGLVEKFTPVLKELKVSQEEAQKLADLMVEDQMAKEAAYKEITEGWKQETIKTLGSDHEAKMGVAAKFIDKFGNDKVRQVLNDTGLGNHPEIVQMFINAGKHFGNDPFVAGATKKNAVADPERQARKFFPNTKFE